MTDRRLYCKVRLVQANKMEARINSHKTYVYFRIPSNLDVQIITLLSAPPDANLFPTVKIHMLLESKLGMARALLDP